MSFQFDKHVRLIAAGIAALSLALVTMASPL